MLLFGAAGSIIAGGYGIAHDQVTYSISPEYFTHFKFHQFHYLDLTQPHRLIVGEIGFLATFWVGLFSAWFMARITLPHESLPNAARRCAIGVGMIVAAAITGGIVGNALAPSDLDSPSAECFNDLMLQLEILDRHAFARVGSIHNGGYAGALVGLIGSLLWLRLSRKPSRSPIR